MAVSKEVTEEGAKEIGLERKRMTIKTSKVQHDVQVKQLESRRREWVRTEMGQRQQTKGD